MALAITRVTLNGVLVALAEVLADVTIHHGRSDVYDTANASTCQLTILDITRATSKAFAIGQPLVVYARDGAAAEKPRFTGRVTDGSLDDDDLTIIATGRLSTLSGYTIGAADYPAETWSARVTRAFTDAGLAAFLELVAPPVDPALAARVTATDGTVALSDYLDDLANMIGAAIADRPDGKILVQAVAARTLAGMTVLDPAQVEYVPTWVEVLPTANIVTVQYVGGQTTVQDAASIALYGPRPLEVDTAFTNAAQALDRANERLARSSFSRWSIPEAPLLRGYDTLRIGDAVELSSWPASAPFRTWTPVIEGWTDSVAGFGRDPGTCDWSMDLALSDPLASGLALPWNQVPTAPAYHWNTIDQAVAWKDALSLDSLEP